VSATSARKEALPLQPGRLHCRLADRVGSTSPVITTFLSGLYLILTALMDTEGITEDLAYRVAVAELLALKAFVTNTVNSYVAY
jgi:hypothetical protein